MVFTKFPSGYNVGKRMTSRYCCRLSMGSSPTLNSLYCSISESVDSLLSRFLIVKASHSNFDKLRLLNKDSRFRKDPQYVFYLLWQKEMRELYAGVYNLSKRSQSMTVGTLLSYVQANNEHLEANLCTILRSVCGTKQYWFVRKSELR